MSKLLIDKNDFLSERLKDETRAEDIAYEKFCELVDEALSGASVLLMSSDKKGRNLSYIFESKLQEKIFRLGVNVNQGNIAKKKKPITPAMRKQVFERDEYRCKNCGGHKKLSVDHIIPESAGGPHEISNFQTLCMPCNQKKGVKSEA